MLSIGFFLTRAHNRFATRLLFYRRHVVRCAQKSAASGASNRYYRYGNHAAGSKPVEKLFTGKKSIQNLPQSLSAIYHTTE